MGGHHALAPLESHVGVYAPSIFARKGRLKLVTTKKDCMTKKVSALRHYIKVEMLSVKTP